MKTLPVRRGPAARAALALIPVVVALAVVGLIVTLGSGGATASTYQVKTVKLASGAGVIARWNPCQRAITWKANLKGVPAAKRSAMLGQFRTAFIKLSATNGMTYRYAGLTGFIPRQANLVSQPADIVVSVINPSETDLNFSERSLGFGGVLWATWYGSSGEGAVVMRGYVVLVPAAIARLKAGFGPGRTQGSVILHELGHATGLEHATSRAVLMYPTLTTAAPNGYAAGDKTGLSKLGRKPGCIIIPARVDIKDYD